VHGKRHNVDVDQSHHGEWRTQHDDDANAGLNGERQSSRMFRHRHHERRHDAWRYEFRQFDDAKR